MATRIYELRFDVWYEDEEGNEVDGGTESRRVAAGSLSDAIKAGEAYWQQEGDFPVRSELREAVILAEADDA
ncbi:MAG: hypothetical protein NXI30_04615 [bacterium]|nr:hypothetical protein [bacterium]